jgi:hypothetical protein
MKQLKISLTKVAVCLIKPLQDLNSVQVVVVVMVDHEYLIVVGEFHQIVIPCVMVSREFFDECK